MNGAAASCSRLRMMRRVPPPTARAKRFSRCWRAASAASMGCMSPTCSRDRARSGSKPCRAARRIACSANRIAGRFGSGSRARPAPLRPAAVRRALWHRRGQRRARQAQPAWVGRRGQPDLDRDRRQGGRRSRRVCNRCDTQGRQGETDAAQAGLDRRTISRPSQLTTPARARYNPPTGVPRHSASACATIGAIAPPRMPPALNATEAPV